MLHMCLVYYFLKCLLVIYIMGMSLSKGFSKKKKSWTQITPKHKKELFEN